MANKLVDCVTFFNDKNAFELRYNTLKNYFDFFLICESTYDHRGNKKNLNFLIEKYNSEKIKYIILEEPFPSDTNLWLNQAIQRDYILKNLDFVDNEDYIFFSDPDEIPNPKILENFKLNEKYGIFLQSCYNYKINLFNPYETPWEGTRVTKMKNLKSIDYMRQKIKSKNIKYPFWRFDKDKSIELFKDGGWHFNNLMNAEDISKKLKTFAHKEFANEHFSNVETIKKKIEARIDLFNRGHKYIKHELDNNFPEYVLKNIEKYKDYILK